MATAQPQLSADGSAALDAFLEQTVAETYVPGIVALVTSANGTIYLGSAGYEDVADRRPMRQDAIFGIASMTKPITSSLIMMLVDEGRIALDDAAANYVPEVIPDTVFVDFDPATKRYSTRPAAGPMTIRHLLTHTSGLGYPWADATLYALIGSGQPSPSVTTLPLLFDPGTRWNYGESTRVLGTLAATVTQRPMTELYAERIFEPLEMTDTGWRVPDAKRDRVVTSHRRVGDALLELPRANGPIGGAPRGDGGLYSTAPDYAKFLRMLLGDGVSERGERLLSAESVATMRRNHIGDLHVELQSIADATRARPFPVGAGRDTFGLGFQVTGPHDDPELRSPGSLSWAGIQNTEFWLDPQRGIGAVLLLQYLPFYDETAIAVLDRFERLVNSHLISE
jgi:CubicO group peptidase (beta-lactamase class C family)